MSVQQPTGILDNGPGEYIITGFATQPGVPGTAGLIPAGSTTTVNLYAYQHPNCTKFGDCPPLTPVYLRFKLFKNDGTGSPLCTATAGAALSSTTVNLQTISCVIATPTNFLSTDRFYLWVGVYSSGSYGQMAGVDVEGVAGGLYDSTVLTPNIVKAPSITSLSLTSGALGTTVRIYGANLDSDKASTVVHFNGANANPSTFDSNHSWIEVVVPSGALTGNITVSNVAGTSNGVLFTVTQPPSIAGVSPNPATVGTQVTVSGSYFGDVQGSSTITFSPGIPGGSPIWSNGSIKTTVPPNATTGPITVTTQYGSSSIAFTVVAIPQLQSVEPSCAPVGGIINLLGNGFGSSQGNSTVTFDGNIAPTSYPSWTDASIFVKVPQLSTGTHTVAVTTLGGATSGSVEISDPPAPAAITPSSGPEGTTVTISGAGFCSLQGNSTAAIGGIPINVTSWSSGEIAGTVAPGTPDGSVTVTVAQFTSEGPAFTVTTNARLTDSLGYVSNFTSGTKGGMKRLLDADGSGCSSCTQRGLIHNTYDGKGNVSSSHDELLRTTDYTYDSDNNVASVKKYLNASPVTTSYQYNSFGEVTQVTDALGNITTNAYDGKGNLLSVTTPVPGNGAGASVTQFGYDPKGQLTSITDPLGHGTTITYTSAGLVASITDAQNNVTSYQYDGRGNRTAVIDPVNGAAHPTTFTYDLMDRLLRITYPDGTHTDFGYDYRGRRTSVTDQNNRTTTYAYDDADRLVSVTDAATQTTQYGYDTENNLVSITDANGNPTTFGYDQFGRVVHTNFPSSFQEVYGYDAVGNLTSKTDRKGQTILYVYDALDRLTHKGYPDSSGVDYVYDLVGKLLQVNDPTGTYGFAYDNMGRLIGTTTQYAFLPGKTFANGYGYDAASNRTSYSGDGGTSSYAYDTANRLTNLTSGWAGLFTFGYDTLNRRTSLNRPNGVNTGYSYDALSRLLTLQHNRGGATIDGAGYSYDSAGNRASKTNYLNGMTDSYSYDPVYQLTQVTGPAGESYTYDSVGNRLSSAGVPTYSYNSSNQLTSTSAATFAYDYNGNTTSKTDANGATAYTWDYENRLSSVTLPGNGGTVNFKYDPFGRRSMKVVPSGTTTIYAYDGANVIGEFNASGNSTALYAQGLSIDEPLAVSRSGAVSFYEADGLGSITSLTDNAGAFAASYTRDSFGNQLTSSGMIVNPIRFTAREWDQETGLYYYRARYYDPNIGRFSSEDPARFVARSPNFFQYAYGNPVNYMDPTGRAPTWWHLSMTRRLAEEIFGPKCKIFALIVADADASVDRTPGMWNKVKFAFAQGEAWRYGGPHFPMFNEVLAAEENAVKTCVLSSLGHALHSEQDMDTHFDIGPLSPIAHWVSTIGEDYGALIDDNARGLAIQRTRYWLQQFKDRCLKCCQ